MISKESSWSLSRGIGQALDHCRGGLGRLLITVTVDWAGSWSLSRWIGQALDHWRGGLGRLLIVVAGDWAGSWSLSRGIGQALDCCRGGLGRLLIIVAEDWAGSWSLSRWVGQKDYQQNLPKLTHRLKDVNDFVIRVFPYLDTTELFKYEIMLIHELALNQEKLVSLICKALTSLLNL